MITTRAFEANDSREELRASLSGSSPWDYQDLDDDFEVYPLPSRWLTSDPAAEFGIPAELAYLECALYRRLPKQLAENWPERFVNAIPAGENLGEVASRLMLWLLRDPASPLMYDAGTVQRLWRDRLPFEEVASLYDRKLSGEQPEREEGQALSAEASQRVAPDICSGNAVVIYACSAVQMMAEYVAMPEKVQLPAAGIRCAAAALGQFEYYSRRRPTPRASWDATYVAAANGLVGLIMEAPKTCPQMHTTMGELNDPENAPWC